MRSLASALPTGALLAAAAILALVVGWIAPQQPILAVVVATAVLALGVSAVQRAAIPLLVLPLLYVAERLGYGATDLSVSDLALTIGMLAAVCFAQRPLSPALRNLLWLVAVYQVATLFTVVANPYAANLLEWLHSGILIAGALMVGWAVGRDGHGRLGLLLMTATAVVLATWVIVVGTIHYLEGNFEPVYLPFRMHKNFLGTTLATSATIAYVRPDWLRLRPALATACFWWIVLGIVMTQSRQAIVGLAVVLVVLVLRRRTDRRRSQVILLAVVPAVVVVLTLVRDQLASGNQHNSVFSRLTWFEEALEIWSTQPLVGVGLRWWYTDRFPGGIQPPNGLLEVLTASGLAGLAGFLALMIGSVLVLWRIPPEYGMLAVLVVIGRFVQGQLDIFWVAAQTSIPFVIAGICLGLHARDEGTAHTREELRATIPDAPVPTTRVESP